MIFNYHQTSVSDIANQPITEAFTSEREIASQPIHRSAMFQQTNEPTNRQINQYPCQCRLVRIRSFILLSVVQMGRNFYSTEDNLEGGNKGRAKKAEC